MKKAKLLFTLVTALFIIPTLASCQPNDSSTSGSSTSEIITGVKIAGPKTVKVGEKINLVADVVGSENDEVNWESLTPDVASIDENGTVLGIKAGDASIKATSVKNSNYYATWDVKVSQDLAKEVELVVLDDSEDIIVGENGVYNVPVGQTIHLSYKIGEGLSDPDLVSYSLVESSEELANVSLTTNQDKTGELVFLSALENVAIKVNASYITSATGSLTSTKYFTSYSINKENVDKFNDAMDKFQSLETSKMVSAEVTSKKTLNVSSSEETLDEHLLKFAMYQDATYGSDEHKDVETTYTYSALDNKNQIYYLFAYDNETLNIVDVFDGTSYDSSKASLYKQYANSATVFVNDGIPTYGFANVLKLIVNDVNYKGYPSLGYYASMAYADFVFTEDKIEITSHFIDEISSAEYTYSLIINLDLEGKVTSYTYDVVEIIGGVTNNYHEAATMVYGEKLVDNSSNNSNYLGFERYYISDFDLRCIAGESDPDGKWDFTDTTKFGYDKLETIDGVDHYTLTYDKSLPLALTNISPSTGSTRIDLVKVKGVSSNGTRNFSVINGGTFAVSAPKATDGSSIALTETFTATSVGGGTVSFVINFIEPDVTSIILGLGESNIENNTFPTIFTNGSTGYFYLNTVPDDPINHHFALEILQGPTDGLELFQWGDDNDYGYPGFAYSIRGKKSGNYLLRFYVIEAANVKTEVYNLTVEEPFSADKIESSIVNKSYSYSTSTTTYHLDFISNQIMKLSIEDMLGQVTSREIAYDISDGKITIRDEEQIFSQPFYFNKVKGGDIVFAYDFSTVAIFLEIYDSLIQDEYSRYALYTFSEVKDTSDIMKYIDGRTYTTETFITGLAKMNIKISFNGGKGEMILTNPYDESYKSTISFDYSFDSKYSQFIFTNVNCSDSALSVKNAEQSYIDSTMTLQIWVTYTGQYGSMDTRIDFNLK